MSSGEQEELRLADALEQGTYLLSVERNATAAELRRLHDVEVEAQRTERNRDMWKAQCHSQASELANLRARLDRAIKAAEEHFGEDAIRYKLSLFKNGRASNYFPQEFDGKWFALQRADNDAHVGLCDRINQLVAEREADRETMDDALNALVAVRAAVPDLHEYGNLAGNTLGSRVDAAISSLKARTQ